MMPVRFATRSRLRAAALSLAAVLILLPGLPVILSAGSRLLAQPGAIVREGGEEIFYIFVSAKIATYSD